MEPTASLIQAVQNRHLTSMKALLAFLLWVLLEPVVVALMQTVQNRTKCARKGQVKIGTRVLIEPPAGECGRGAQAGMMQEGSTRARPAHRLTLHVPYLLNLDFVSGRICSKIAGAPSRSDSARSASLRTIQVTIRAPIRRVASHTKGLRRSANLYEM